MQRNVQRFPYEGLCNPVAIVQRSRGITLPCEGAVLAIGNELVSFVGT